MFLFNTHNNCRLLNYFEKCLNVCFEVLVFQLIVCLFINIFCLFINMLGESRSEGTYFMYFLLLSLYSSVKCLFDSILFLKSSFFYLFIIIVSQVFVRFTSLVLFLFLKSSFLYCFINPIKS